MPDEEIIQITLADGGVLIMPRSNPHRIIRRPPSMALGSAPFEARMLRQFADDILTAAHELALKTGTAENP